MIQPTKNENLSKQTMGNRRENGETGTKEGKETALESDQHKDSAITEATRIRQFQLPNKT